MKLKFSRQFYEEKAQILSLIKNSSSESRVVPYGRADMTVLVVDFRKNAPKNPSELF
jgi:hypothetical protein